MATLIVEAPKAVDVGELAAEIVAAIADRLRDEHGYDVPAGVPVIASARSEYPLSPSGRIVVDVQPGVLTVKLHDVDVDAHDLFTLVSSELEQRHDGLRVEID